MNFVDEIASEYGGDPSKRQMCGDSAERTFVSIFRQIQNNNDIAAAAGISPIIPRNKGAWFYQRHVLYR